MLRGLSYENYRGGTKGTIRKSIISSWKLLLRLEFFARTFVFHRNVFIRTIFIKKWASKIPKMLRKSSASNGCAATFKNPNFF